MITEQLNTIEVILRDKNITSLHYLQAGISYVEIKQHIDNLYPIKGSHELLAELYSWHDGTLLNFTDPVDCFKITPLFFFNSLKNISQIIGEDADTREFRKRNQIPLFSSGHGEFLSLDINELNENPEKAICYYVSTWNPEFDLYTPMYRNIFCFFNAVIECYNAGVYYNEGGIIECDQEQEYKITLKHNKSLLDYWR